jgi:hypothetical protein
MHSNKHQSEPLLMIELGVSVLHWNHKTSFSFIKLSTHFTPGFVLLSSVLMNVGEIYVSRMILLLVKVSASALSRCSPG